MAATNATLQFKITELIKEKEDTKNRLEKKINQLNQDLSEARRELNDYKKREAISSTEDSIIKFALEERAKNKNLGVIGQLINQTFYTTYTAKDIERMIGNINDLPLNLQEFYYAKLEQFCKLRKIDDKIEKDNIVQNLTYLYDKISILIENADTTNDTERREYKDNIKLMKEILDTKGKFNKELAGTEIPENEALAKIAKSLTSALSNKAKGELEGLDILDYTIC